jgi:hypothetical protein
MARISSSVMTTALATHHWQIAWIWKSSIAVR